MLSSLLISVKHCFTSSCSSSRKLSTWHPSASSPAGPTGSDNMSYPSLPATSTHIFFTSGKRTQKCNLLESPKVIQKDKCEFHAVKKRSQTPWNGDLCLLNRCENAVSAEFSLYMQQSLTIFLNRIMNIMLNQKFVWYAFAKVDMNNEKAAMQTYNVCTVVKCILSQLYHPHWGHYCSVHFIAHSATYDNVCSTQNAQCA